MFDLIKILLVLGLLIILVWRKVDIGLSILSAAVLLGLLFSMPFAMFIKDIPNVAFSKETIQLATAIILVLVFNDLWKESGQLKLVIDKIEYIFQDARVTVAALPAIIGLMPIMGGAYLSAPLVDESSEKLNLSNEHKSFINYWFRHIWEYFLPTYPGVLLAASIFGCSISTVVSHNFMLSIAAISGGFLAGLWGLKKPKLEEHEKPEVVDHFSFLFALLPLAVLLSLALVFKIDMSYALIITIILSIFIYRIPLKKFFSIFKKNFSWSMLTIVFAIMYFKEILQSSGAMGMLSGDFQNLGISLVWLAIFMPFIVGLLTGMASAFVGMTFPLIASLSNDISFLPLAYASGYCGMLLSPTHLCLVMTREYFNSRFSGIYARMIVPLILVFLTSLGLFFMLKK